MTPSRISLALVLPFGIVLAACTGDKGENTNNLDDTSDTDTDTDTNGVDSDGDGYGADEDCDDLDADVYPGATEVCDGIDNDCNGEIDEGVLDTYYYDADGDGFGDIENSVEACEALTDYVPNDNDCNDADDSIFPGAEELCDGLDNNCDGTIDEDLSSVTWYADSDGDGYGNGDDSTEACEQPTGYVDNDWDCNDADVGEPVHVSADGSTWAKKFAPAPDTGDTADTGPWDTAPEPTGAGTQDDPFATIQEGINAADDCVFVFDGTYNEDISFNGKDILVTGVDGASGTTIEGTGNGPVVTFNNGESGDAVLDNFTITGGTGVSEMDTTTTNCVSTYTCTTTVYTYKGGGIYVVSASPTLQNLIVDSNTLPAYSYTEVSETEDYYVYSFGGGGYFEDSKSTLDGVNWVQNAADVGGGFYSDNSSAISALHNMMDANSAGTGGGSATAGSFTATNSIWINNKSSDSGASYGGAGHDSVDGLFAATNVTFAGNDGLASAFLGASASGSVINSILVENVGGSVLDGNSGASLTLAYSDIYNSLGDAYGSAFADVTGVDGNISSNPSFTAWSDDDDSSNDDLTLKGGSPAIDAGSPVTAYNDPDGSTNDMGAHGGPRANW